MGWKKIDFLIDVCIFYTNKNSNNMKKTIAIRIAAIICGILLFHPIYKLMEWRRHAAFQGWFMQDNSFGYNRPWDFGSTGSVVIATIIVLILVSFVWLLTTDTTEKK